jgi:hypothetical protein
LDQFTGSSGVYPVNSTTTSTVLPAVKSTEACLNAGEIKESHASFGRLLKAFDEYLSIDDDTGRPSLDQAQ